MQIGRCPFICFSQGGWFHGEGTNDFAAHVIAKSTANGTLKPGQPIVEIAGDRRVLIENHFGVKEYSREKIGVKVKYGLVCVCGCNLELIRMTKEQLIISGRIDAVTLIRRG